MPKGRKSKPRRSPRIGRQPGNTEAEKEGRVIALSRKDVLIRELDMAIYLWFFDFDPVSVHLLVKPAQRCLDDIGHRRGVRPFLKELMEGEDDDQAYDFFRHASSDLRIHLDFAPEINQWIIWDSINAFAKIFGDRTVYMKCFSAYTAMHLASDTAKLVEVRELFFPDGVKIEDFRQVNRLEFFDKMLPLFAGRTQ